MHLARHATVILALVALSAARVSGQDADEVARLKARLEAQEALNQQLLERLQALEASHGELRKTIEQLHETVQTVEAVQEEHESLREDLGVELLDLDERLELLPTITGYYDFEYRNDDRSDSPGESEYTTSGCSSPRNMRIFDSSVKSSSNMEPSS